MTSSPDYTEHESVPVPKYYVILNVLRQSLSKLVPGDQIPSEGELAKQFQVGRVTVQRALALLVNEGLIIRRQGKGSFYTGQTKPSRLHEISGALEGIMVFEKGERATVVEKMVTADVGDDIKQALQSIAARDFVRIKRIVTVATGPVIYLHNYLPLEFGKHILEEEDDDLKISPILYLLRKRYGVSVGRAEQTIDAVLAEPEVANALSISIGLPALRIERIYYKDTGQPVQFTRCWYPSGRYKYKVSFDYRGDLNVSPPR